ncbi:TPM domain-containing protein [Geodermatophilus ruber]|uniref:TLP18.3, Psb32 and MOLO-1 founding protein of phosphatase n=1 Tax=Geodermatophilus ruber TaxID=504800 RepID=A0A1I4DF06_9ACTN|nr:TPM domain-containing protein [Geodermatophilus ruber]SFK90676.1 TLP18.3, Psb32 and MOLO-1 founding protein of phosphatase [Geodermatophilus ruber]
MRRLTIALGLLVVFLLAGGTPALAEPPSGVTGQVTDRVGALAGREEEVQQAVEELRAQTGIGLYAVFVATFDGMDRAQWANATAEQSGLGADDVLFAVAVEDRRYGVHYGERIDPGQLQAVLAGDVEPRLSQGDWAGAVISLAEGLGSTETAAGAAGTAAPSTSGGGSGAVTALVVVGMFLLAGGAYLTLRSRRRRRAELPPPVRRLEAPDPHAGTPTEQLNYRASAALLDLDERVRTGQVGLDYARAHYGDEAVPGLVEGMDRTRSELARAFTLRQELDDEIPEDEPTQRRMLTELLALTDAAGRRLQEQAGALDRLREQERTVPQAVEELGARVGQLQQRLPREQERVADLQRRYASSAVAPVLENVGEAGVRLDAAEQAVALAREDQAADRSGRAVGRLRGAESAVAQSGTLLDAIDRLARDLAEAEQRVPGVRADVEGDLAEARALLSADRQGTLRPQIARAEAALSASADALRPADGSGGDPLAALRRLEEADLALEQALRNVRDEQTRARRAAEALEQALLTARSAVAAAEDFIGTRRGAVGATARTRLAEAQRHLAAAEAHAERDPAGALREAQTADRLAQQALHVAGSDVERWSQQNSYGGYGGYGGGWGQGGPGYGGPGYGRRGISPLGAGLGGLVLGGLLFGGGDDGGGDWSAGDFGGGDFGGGDFGGDFGGGDF